MGIILQTYWGKELLYLDTFEHNFGDDHLQFLPVLKLSSLDCSVMIYFGVHFCELHHTHSWCWAAQCNVELIANVFMNEIDWSGVDQPCCIICFALFCVCLVLFVWLSVSAVCVWERPNHNESTASRLLSEVKHCRAWLVLRWGTTLETWVLFSFLLVYYKGPTPPINFARTILQALLPATLSKMSAAVERTPWELQFPLFWGL